MCPQQEAFVKTDVLIIGGGLSGLSLARQLEKQGRDYHLVEARARFGGRIYSRAVQSGEQVAHFDLGPAWFWPGQPRMAKLIHACGLEYFDQHYAGHSMHEDARGPAQRARGFASMQGSYRLKGSLTALIEGLVKQLPPKRLSLGVRALSLSYDGDITTHLSDEDGNTHHIVSDDVVLAIPPRIAADTIDYQGGVPPRSLEAMRAIPTWMAGHAKVVAVYERPFWRDAGLSGDAMSRRGPLTQIHDASPEEGGLGAIFGFVGTPIDVRKNQPKALLNAAKEQLIRLFGSKAATPLDMFLQDWAFETTTATTRDHAPLRHHPTYGLPDALDGLWDGHLILGSTEAALQFGGYLEGALEAAEHALAKLSG